MQRGERAELGDSSVEGRLHLPTAVVCHHSRRRRRRLLADETVWRRRGQRLTLLMLIGVASYGALGHVPPPPRLPASYFGDH